MQNHIFNSLIDNQSMKILLVTSTSNEAEALRKIEGLVPSGKDFIYGSLKISLLITGVGAVPTAWHMMKWISENGRPDAAINSGIAGSFRDHIRTGDVVMPVSDCFADYGIEDGEETFTLFDAGLSGGNDFPFNGGLLKAENQYTEKLKAHISPVKSVTLGTASGSERTINELVRRFDPDIESMEGASFFYICIRESIPCFAVRAISNRVERRNRNNWNIPLAIGNLSGKLKEVFQLVEKG